MMAAFQKQMRQIYGGLCGWILLSLTLLATGVLSVIYHIIHASGELSSVTAMLAELLIVTCPIAAAFCFTEENRQGTTPWLCSLPTARLSITLGSYFATLTVFLFPTIVLLILPVALSFLGDVSMESSYTAILGYVLFTVCLLAILSTVASCFCKRWQAIATGIGVCLGIYLLPYLGSLIASYPVVGPIVLTLIGAGALCLTLGIRRKKWTFAALWSVLVAGVCFLLLWVLPVAYERLLPDLLGFFDLFGRVREFSAGHFDLSSTCLFLSLTALFLTLTVTLRPRLGGAMRFSPRPREGKALAILLASSILLNAGVMLLPFDLRYPSVTDSSVYSLSDTSERYLRELDRDVELIYYCEGGAANADRDLYPFLLSITRKSDRVRLTVEDLRGEDTSVTDHTIRVRSGARSRLLTASDLYYYYNSYTGISFTLSEYVALMEHISAETDASRRAQLLATYSNGQTVGRFSGEGAILNAIRYVLSSDPPHLVVMGEDLNGTSAFLTRRLEDAGYTVDRVDGIAQLPPACDALLLHLTEDLTEGEASTLSAYLSGGGQLLLTTSYASTDLPRLYGVLSSFGLSASSEMSLLYHSQEGEAFSTVYGDHPAVAGLTSPFLAYGAHAIDVTATDGVSHIPLLYTPSGVYNLTPSNVSDPSASLGSYLMGVTARRGDATVTWISMPFDTTSEVLSSSSNFSFAESLLAWMTLHTGQSLPLSARSLPSSSLTVSDTILIVWIVLFALLLPQLAPSIGLVRRRRG